MIRRRILLLALVMGALCFWLVGMGTATAPPTAQRRGQLPPQHRVEPPVELPRATDPSTLATVEAEPGSARRPLISGGWGDGPGQFGRSDPRDGEVEGPMSLSLGARTISVLDQVNNRVQRFGHDGALIGSFPIERATAQELITDAAGRTLVLDRAKQGSIGIYGPDGERLPRVALDPKTVGEGGMLTSLYSNDKGIFVEIEHDKVVRVADHSGAPVAAEEAPGRPTRDGRLYIKALMVARQDGVVELSAFDDQALLKWKQQVTFGVSLWQLLLLDSDRAGNIYLAAEGAGRTLMVRFDGEGNQTGWLELPRSTVHEADNFQPLAVGDDGTIYQMLPSRGGIEIARHRFTS